MTWQEKKISFLQKDNDGYWIYLKEGWHDLYNPPCHTIHEDTKRQALAIAREAVPCICPDCRDALRALKKQKQR